MGNAHGGVGRVDRLAARTARVIDVDLQILLVQLHLYLVGLGHHGHGRGGGVDTSLRLGRRHALDAVGAALPLEDRVGAVALDREAHLLDAARLVQARGKLFPAKAAPLCVAREHAMDVAGPKRRLVTAHSLTNLDDHVLGVGRVALDQRQAKLLLEPLQLLLGLRRH